MSGRDWEGERRGSKRVRKRDVERVCRGSIDEPVAGRMRAGEGVGVYANGSDIVGECVGANANGSDMVGECVGEV